MITGDAWLSVVISSLHSLLNSLGKKNVRKPFLDFELLIYQAKSFFFEKGRLQLGLKKQLTKNGASIF